MKEETPVKIKRSAEAKPTDVKKEIKTDTKKAKKAAPKKAAAKKPAVKSGTKKELLKITFQLTYGTQFGQNIFISGNIPQLGNGHDENALRLQYIDSLHWAEEIEIDKSSLPKEGLQYFYIIQNEDGSVEKSAPYYLSVDGLVKNIHVFDAWNYEGFIQNAFSTKVFEVLNEKIKTKAKKGASKKVTHQFKIAAPELDSNHVVFLLGNTKELGGWNADEVILLSPDELSGIWSADINLNLGEDTVVYKYGVYDIEQNILISFEEGENRSVAAPKTKTTFSIFNDGFIRYN